MLRKFGSLLIFALVATASSRTWIMPHVLERDGSIMGVAGAVDGGHPTRLEPTKVEYPNLVFTLDMEDNDPIYELIEACMNGERRKPQEWTVLQLPDIEAPGRTVRFLTDTVTSIDFPGWSPASEEPLLCDVSMRIHALSRAGFRDPSPEGQRAAKKAKKAAKKAARKAPPTIKVVRHPELGVLQFGTRFRLNLYSDGGPEAGVSPSIDQLVFNVSVEQAGFFFEQMSPNADGSVKTLTCVVEYPNEEGGENIRIEYIDCQVTSVANADIFATGGENDPFGPIRVCLQKGTVKFFNQSKGFG